MIVRAGPGSAVSGLLARCLECTNLKAFNWPIHCCPIHGSRRESPPDEGTPRQSHTRILASSRPTSSSFVRPKIGQGLGSGGIRSGAANASRSQEARARVKKCPSLETTKTRRQVHQSIMLAATLESVDVHGTNCTCNRKAVDQRCPAGWRTLGGQN